MWWCGHWHLVTYMIVIWWWGTDVQWILIVNQLCVCVCGQVRAVQKETVIFSILRIWRNFSVSCTKTPIHEILVCTLSWLTEWVASQCIVPSDLHCDWLGCLIHSFDAYAMSSSGFTSRHYCCHFSSAFVSVMYNLEWLENPVSGLVYHLLMSNFCIRCYKLDGYLLARYSVLSVQYCMLML